VFRFIIEYSSLTDFGSHVVGLFLYEDFWKMILWLMLKLGIILVIELWYFKWVWFLCKDYIFTWCILEFP
jgi:hypothetical protein